MVKMVDEELKIELSEDMRAASMTANMRPRRPSGMSSLTSMMKAKLVHPFLDAKWQKSEKIDALCKLFLLPPFFYLTWTCKCSRSFQAWRILLRSGTGPLRPFRGTP